MCLQKKYNYLGITNKINNDVKTILCVLQTAYFFFTYLKKYNITKYNLVLKMIIND